MASITNQSVGRPSYESLEEKVKSLQSELEVAKTVNEEIMTVNNTLAARVSNIESETRSEKIASIVSGAYDENVDEKVKYFIKSGLSPDEISKIVQPLKSSSRTKSASYTSQVAIKNEPNGHASKNNAWAESYLGLLNGGSV